MEAVSEEFVVKINAFARIEFCFEVSPAERESLAFLASRLRPRNACGYRIDIDSDCRSVRKKAFQDRSSTTAKGIKYRIPGRGESQELSSHEGLREHRKIWTEGNRSGRPTPPPRLSLRLWTTAKPARHQHSCLVPSTGGRRSGSRFTASPDSWAILPRSKITPNFFSRYTNCRATEV